MIKRSTYRNFRLAFSLWQWFVRRFTRPGRWVLMALGVTALVGMNTKATLAYQIFSFLFSLLSISVLWTVFWRPRFSAERSLPRYASNGDPFSYSLLIKNHTTRFQKGLYVWEDMEDPQPSLSEFYSAREPLEMTRNLFDRAGGWHRWVWLLKWKRGAVLHRQPVPPIPPGGQVEVKMPITPTRRGILRFSGVFVARPDIFGLCASLSPISIPQSLLVLPRRFPVPRLDLPGLRKHHPQGVHLAASVGDSEEFLSLRDYRPGDSLRRISWKSWARTGKPVVREYEEEFYVRHALVLDSFGLPFASPLFEKAVSLAASYAASVRTQESLLDLLFVGAKAYCVSAGRGQGSTESLLEILASVPISQDKSFDLLANAVLERAPYISGSILVLVAWDEARQGLVKRLRALGMPLEVFLLWEGEKPPEPGPLLDDPARFHPVKAEGPEEGLIFA